MKSIYQIKITLKGIKPPIWRRVEVHSDILLIHFSHLVLNVMGWYSSHLFSLEFDREEYFSDKETAEECGGHSMGNKKLNAFLTEPKEKGLLTYDFGDNWEHEILLEKILAPEPGGKYPNLNAGKRNCPPEDCGGIWGYYHLLEVMKDPKHPEYEDMMEWLGEEYDPEAWSLEAL